MDKKTVRIVSIVVAVMVVVFAIIGAVVFVRSSSRKNEVVSSVKSSFDPLNISYSIDGTVTDLVNGKNEQEAAPGSTTKIVTQVFGEPTLGDINSDGKSDAAVMLVQDGGGSGTFYYVAAAINSADGVGVSNSASGTNAIFLGDRIAPDTIQIKNGVVVINYADRAANDPMTTTPSIGVSKYLVTAKNASGTVSLYEAPIGDAYPLASGITWGDMAAATTTIPSAGARGGQVTLVGVSITSQAITNLTNLSAVSSPFEKYYQKKLTGAGWKVDNSIAAGGPGADIVGYKKGNEYIIIQYASVFKNDGGGTTPETCPCDMTFSIFAGVPEE